MVCSGVSGGGVWVWERQQILYSARAPKWLETALVTDLII